MVELGLLRRRVDVRLCVQQVGQNQHSQPALHQGRWQLLPSASQISDYYS